MVNISHKQIERAREVGARGPVVVTVRYNRTDERLEIGFANGVHLAVPVALIQDLQMLKPVPTAAQLAEVEVWGGGQSVFFPQLDLSLWAPGLLQGVFGTRGWMRELARGMGSATSPAKAAAARANGRKGGRPRKQSLATDQEAKQTA